MRLFFKLIIVLLYGVVTPSLLFLTWEHYDNLQVRTTEAAFSRIYQKNLWGYGSGPGSDPINAEPYISIVRNYALRQDINSIFDLGCGDFRVMEKIEIPETKVYYGFDVVKPVIDENVKKYQKPNVFFYHISSLEDFKNQRGDLLLVKDVLHHLSNRDIQYFIANILPNFRYTLITNNFGPENLNEEIRTGDFRNLDLEVEPFNIKRNITPILDYDAHEITKRIYLYERRT